MIPTDPLACRRALREIREIAAVALLDGARMSEQEALQTIGAIADWAADDVAGAADCGGVIRRLDAMIDTASLDEMDDRSALDLFRQVTTLLRDGAAPLDAIEAP